MGARTLRAATGAIERRKHELQDAKEAEAREKRDRVRASQMVHVPAHLAASIEARTHPAGPGSPLTRMSASARAHGAAGGVLGNPHSVLNQKAQSSEHHGSCVGAGSSSANDAALEC